ncbi:MAG: response regulator transcription factor [Anaerolineae bacterium]|jgi:DNA-binding response OmpR family regulator
MRESSILVVDDDPTVSEVVSLYLERAGYRVQVREDGEAAIESLERSLPDLVVLDLALPKVGGLEVARWLRARADTPIIMLTARGRESDRILGLELGADDYVVKPFSPGELVSRVKAVLRRTGGPGVSATEGPLEFDDLLVDPRRRVVEVSGEEVSLTAQEFDLLWQLARHPGQVFSRDRLLDLAWGLTEYIDASTVTVHVHRLREKIESEPAHPRYIQTVWGVGYKFEP